MLAVTKVPTVRCRACPHSPQQLPPSANEMPTRIRLRRMGRKKKAHYRVVVADGRSPRDGRFVDTIGHYKPYSDPARLVLDLEAVDAWIERGAQPSNTVRSLIRKARKGGDAKVSLGEQTVEDTATSDGEREATRAERLAEESVQRVATEADSGKTAKADADSGKTAKAEADSDKTGKAEADSGKTAKADADSGKTGKAEADSDKTGKAEADSDKTGKAEADSDKTGKADADSGKTAKAEADSGKTGKAEADSGKTGKAEADSDKTAEGESPAG